MGRVQKSDKVEHQFSLFGYQKPIAKIPISADRIQQLKDDIAKGRKRSALKGMRNLLDHLQNIEKRISNGKINP